MSLKCKFVIKHETCAIYHRRHGNNRKFKWSVKLEWMHKHKLVQKDVYHIGKLETRKKGLTWRFSTRLHMHVCLSWAMWFSARSSTWCLEFHSSSWLSMHFHFFSLSSASVNHTNIWKTFSCCFKLRTMMMQHQPTKSWDRERALWRVIFFVYLKTENDAGINFIQFHSFGLRHEVCLYVYSI